MVQFNEFTLIFFKNEEKIIEETFKNLDSENDCIKINLFDYNTILDIENKIFIRENEEFKFTLDILNKECTIYLKKENMTIPVLVEYCELTTLETKIMLEYVIESEDARNKLIITKKGERL